MCWHFLKALLCFTGKNAYKSKDAKDDLSKFALLQTLIDLAYIEQMGGGNLNLLPTNENLENLTMVRFFGFWNLDLKKFINPYFY